MTEHSHKCVGSAGKREVVAKGGWVGGMKEARDGGRG